MLGKVIRGIFWNILGRPLFALQARYVAAIDKPRSIYNKAFSRIIWNPLFYLIIFLAGIISIWPDAILKDFWDWTIYYATGLKGNVDEYSNILTMWLFLFSAILLWGTIGMTLSFEPMKNRLVGRIILYLMLPLGIFTGLAWKTSVKTTHYQDIMNNEYPYVADKHWRPQIREFTGMDFILGIDLTIPNAPRYDDERKAKLEAVHELVMKGYHAKTPAERKALRDQALKERLATDEVHERLYGQPWKKWHEAMYADPANDCRHKLFCTTSGNELRIAAEHEWESKKTQRDYARHHNIVLFEN